MWAWWIGCAGRGFSFGARYGGRAGPGEWDAVAEQNVFDNETFFEGYRRLRENPASANELVEKPAFFSLCPELWQRTVLDLGCGFGENCREFARRGAVRVVGLDGSARMLGVAQRETRDARVRYIHGDMSDLSGLPGRFDLVTSSLAVHYVRDFGTLARQVFGLLAPGGVFLFSQEHPLTTAPRAGSAWSRDESGAIRHYRLADYGRPGRRESHWFVDGVVKYHRTFSDILEALLSAGFAIERVLEPLPDEAVMERYPSYQKYYHKPDFLLVRAGKPGAVRST